MNMHGEPRYLEWPKVFPVSKEEMQTFRDTCSAMMAKGRETSEIVRDMLRAGNEITALVDEIDAFLKSEPELRRPRNG